MRKVGIIATIVLCLFIIIGTFFYFAQDSTGSVKPVITTHDKAAVNADMQRAEVLINENKIEEAINILNQYEMSPKTQEGQKWLDLLIDASMKSANFSQLIILYEAYPRAFENREDAIVMVADGYILSRKPQNYYEIQQNWKDRSTLKDTWFNLDVDALLVEGKKQEALKLLKSTKFEGKQDIGRLTRLALMTAVDNPKKAWEYLDAAYTIDPKNADVLTYRGKLLESLGKDSFALYEYMAAVQSAPQNLLLRDQLAEYYMRRNQAPIAMGIWLDTLTQPSLDIIWVKLLFWSKVLIPLNADWSKASPPSGKDKAFIEYLIALPSNSFWDEAAFNKLSNSKKYLSEVQLTFWLRLMELLKQGHEKEAGKLLQFNPFKGKLLNPLLEKGLQQIIAYRQNGSLNIENPNRNLQDSTEKQPKNKQVKELTGKESFFELLNFYAIRQLENPEKKNILPAELNNLLKSKEIFSAALLASGWLEAALQLHTEEIIPANLPQWLPYGLTQALRSNRSAEEALTFALKQPKTPSLSLLIAELYMNTNQIQQALTTLQPFLEDKTDTGYRATYLMSLIYIEKQEYSKAKALLDSQPKLSKDPLGMEAMARIALLEGDNNLAEKLYTQLQDKSPEALSYLARKAFADKDLQRAQQLTEQLILLFPDNPILRDNLNTIMTEQKAQNTP